MEFEEIKYVWLRWPALFFLFVVACLGLFLLYVCFLTNFDSANKLFPMLHVVGFIFFLFGTIAGIEHYRNGIIYTQKARCSFEELDKVIKFNNGLLIAFKNIAKLITYNSDKLVERNYVKILIEFDRNKKEKMWHFMVP